MKGKRILTGDRPTGQLHLGHYFGTLKNRVELQEENELYIIIADMQVLTDHLDKRNAIENNIFEVTCDYLAVGLDPEKTNIFIQSKIPELTELTMYFSFLVPFSRIRRNPTIKSEIQMYSSDRINAEEQMSMGFFTYPISQAADILIFKAEIVPVGQDQSAHLEQTREIARSFNKTFGHIFPMPQTMIGECPVLKGTDGKNKMSKSLDNNIAFAHTPDEVQQRILCMVTDPKRIRLTDSGNPEECNVYSYWQLFAPKEDCQIIKQDCINANNGCKDCKKSLSVIVNDFLDEFRIRRNYYASKPNIIWDILAEGTLNARIIAESTIEEVRDAMNISYYKLPQISKSLK